MRVSFFRTKSRKSGGYGLPLLMFSSCLAGCGNVPDWLEIVIPLRVGTGEAEAGPEGPPGNPGADGANCFDVRDDWNGPEGVPDGVLDAWDCQGAMGVPGEPGERGSDGQDGADGQPGATGPPGSDAPPAPAPEPCTHPHHCPQVP